MYWVSMLKQGRLRGCGTRLRGANGRVRRIPLGCLLTRRCRTRIFEQFLNSYLTTKADWAKKDFGKPNIERFGAKNQDWHAESAEVIVEETTEAHRVVVSLLLKDDAAFDSGRAAFPRHVFVELVLPKAEPEIHLTLSWFGKPATRMPEALWLTFNPIAEDQKRWTLDKSGEAISPFDVVASGNRSMHCLQTGF